MNPADYSDCPKEFQNEPKIQEAWKRGWMALVKKYPTEYVFCPSELKELPEMQDSWKEGWIKSWCI